MNLEKRQAELEEELEELQENGVNDQEERTVAKKEENDADYFESKVKKFKEYISHLQKRNEVERKNIL